MTSKIFCSRCVLKWFILGVLVFVGLVFWFWPASHDRNWEHGQTQIPNVEIEGSSVVINNFRNFDWLEDEGSTPVVYETKRFELSDITGVEGVISHFSEKEGIAHVFLNFPLVDGTGVSLSIEARRNDGEPYSPWKGIWKKYELIYIFASSEDLIGLRTEVRGERVYQYPLQAKPESAQALFVRLSQTVNDIDQKPRFYNTLFSNCANLLTREAKDLFDVSFPWRYKVYTPGTIDEILYEKNLIEHHGDWEETKEFYRVK